MKRRKIHAKQATSDHACLEEDAEPLIIEDRAVRNLDQFVRRRYYSSAEALAEQRVRSELGVQRGAESGQPTAADVLVLLFGDEAAFWQERLLQGRQACRVALCGAR